MFGLWPLAKNLTSSPISYNIKCTSKSPIALHSITIAKNYWMRREIQQWYGRRYSLNLHLKLVQQRLAQLYSSVKLHLLSIFNIIMFHLKPTPLSLSKIDNACEAQLVVLYKRFLMKIERSHSHVWFVTACQKLNIFPNFI